MKVIGKATKVISTVIIEVPLEEAVELQKTITSAFSSPVKDRLFDGLTHLFRKHQIKGGVFL